MLARNMKAMLIAAISVGAATSAQAQTGPTAAAAQTQNASTANHAESGRVTMRHTAAHTCPTGESGIRRQVFPIRFRFPFANNRYAAMVGVSGLDSEHDRNVRIDTAVENRTRDGMTIIAWTWCNSIIHSANIDFMVVGRR